MAVPKLGYRSISIVTRDEQEETEGGRVTPKREISKYEKKTTDDRTTFYNQFQV